MKGLVFIETDNGVVKETALEAVSYASNVCNEDVVALVFGDADNLTEIGKAGATKILQVNDPRFLEQNIMAYATNISAVFEKENLDVIVMAKSSLSDAIAGRIAVKSNLSYVSNVVSLPEVNGEELILRSSIYTGKAFAKIKLSEGKNLISIKKNTVEVKKDGTSVTAQEMDPVMNESDFVIKMISRNKNLGKVSLPEANIVVSAGRGLKDPENWGMIEELAEVLGAATACSKPVSDMGWRSHSEHVGQTGIKISPSLYIAVGISGAIQHLAGVNSSRYIVVINKDEDAPFFKAADYGIVGDAFDVVPKLIQQLRK